MMKIQIRVMTFASSLETIDAANFVSRNVGLTKWESQSYHAEAGRFTYEVSETLGDRIETALREGGFAFASETAEVESACFEDGFYSEAEYDAMMAESENDWIDRIYEDADANVEQEAALA